AGQARHSRLRTVAVLLCVCLGLTAVVRGAGKLMTADLVRFLRAGISEETILTELRSRGFGETLDQARENALREAGATETLIVAVRRIMPGASESSAPPASGTGSSAPSARGSGSSAPSVAHGPTFAAGTKTVRVPVSVVDKAGAPVLGLSGTDFKIK